MKSFSLIFLRFYVKLQDAYVSEKGTAVGSWKQIGYLMKNSNNFYYCGAATCAAGSNTDVMVDRMILRLLMARQTILAVCGQLITLQH